MKSERRHELGHNELADWSMRVVEAIKPYTNVIIGGTIAVIILAAGLSLWSNQAKLESGTAWNLYYEALNSNDPDALQDVIDSYPGTEAALWAAIYGGDAYLNAGCHNLFFDKAVANKDLDQAIKCYEAILTSENSRLKERATFGLAQVYEAQGELEKAKSAYENQLKQWGDGSYSGIAKSRLANLKKPSTLEFYDWFVKYDPKPAFPSEDSPTSFEDTDVPEQPATDTPTTDTPATDTPATDTPATDTPATDTPAKETKEEPKEEGK